MTSEATPLGRVQLCLPELWPVQFRKVQLSLDRTDAVLSSHLSDTFGAESTCGSTADPYRYGGQWGYYTDGETGLCLLTHGTMIRARDGS